MADGKNLVGEWRLAARESMRAYLHHRLMKDIDVPGAPLAIYEAERLYKLLTEEKSARISVEAPTAAQLP